MSTDDPVLVYPSKEFENAEQFFANFGQVTIPFMEDFAIQAVPDEGADGKPNVCFKSAVLTAVA
eukprot:CAMPEP_0170470744 /NCGR_PEP_ID=MMETSP0123-20130129/13116_1 /TAXON_ID=182087 /ORGANISM="Favella ehrenbergii, Strain Fehren 1" /LENGTH=63 /DNA_ID=CAMNT_0010738003 /DNA_START=423 /DNA_END=611 /DNA_ORIENTATION=+